MEKSTNKSKIDNLEKKISEIKSNKTEKNRNSFKVQNDGWRMVIELVVGMLIGIAIGLGVDIYFSTQPIFLIIFTLFGFAAGVKTMLNTAKSIKRESLQGE